MTTKRKARPTKAEHDRAFYSRQAEIYLTLAGERLKSVLRFLDQAEECLDLAAGKRKRRKK
jgi:hypothetical protein